jgi:Fur family transcriptional regulator, ferric uptake regulator
MAKRPAQAYARTTRSCDRSQLRVLVMSRSHSATPPVPVSDLEGALGVLRASGLRVSAARRIVLEALFRAGGPLTAERIAGGLDGALPPSDTASVYRNLETLEEVGLVRHVHLGHGPGLYALAGRHDAGYAACERCGRHAALDDHALAGIGDAVRAACGFAPALAHFPIVGLCPGCAAGSESR